MEIVLTIDQLPKYEDWYKQKLNTQKKIESLLNKVHKLKRENLVLSDHRKSILRYKSRYNNSNTQTYNDCEIRRICKISERIGKNGNKIQRLRTKISQLKKSLTPVVNE